MVWRQLGIPLITSQGGGHDSGAVGEFEASEWQLGIPFITRYPWGHRPTFYEVKYPMVAEIQGASILRQGCQNKMSLTDTPPVMEFVVDFGSQVSY